MEKFNYIIIGAGSGGTRLARLLGAAGNKVAIFEESDLGGTCVNRGCVPKKFYYYASHVTDELKLNQSYGWSIDNARLHFNHLQTLVQNEVKRLSTIYKNILENANVKIIQGTARFVNANTIECKSIQYQAQTIIVAVGASPFIPAVVGAEHVISSNEFFQMKQIPKTSLVVGGGYIAIELASILNNLGSQTSLIYRGDTILRGFDNTIRHFVQQEAMKKGLNIILNDDIVSIKKEKESCIAHLQSGQNITIDKILYATGRKPKIHELGLENTKVQILKNGKIKINTSFQTADPSIYAIGDVSSSYELTPVAISEAVLLAQNFIEKKHNSMNYDAIATAVFSQPSIGTIGLSEEKAREKYHVEIYQSEFTPMKYAFLEKKEKALFKVIVDQETDKVLGIHIVSSDAGEIIQGFATAFTMGMTKKDLDHTLAIHPTSAEELVTMYQPLK